jgi:hypothetical protein
MNRDFGYARMQQYLDEACSERFLDECIEHDSSWESGRTENFLDDLRYLIRDFFQGLDLQVGTA